MERDSRLLERFKDIETAVVADLLEEHGFPHQVLSPSIARLDESGQVMAGWAFPVQGETVYFEGVDRLKLQAIDAMESDCIAVWSGGRAEGFCVFGDLLATAMIQRGIRGIVVDAGVRDVGYLKLLNIPISVRYVTPLASRRRWKVTSYNTPVRLRGAMGNDVVVHPGDLVLGDADGIVIVPLEQTEKILTVAEQLQETDGHSRKLVLGGTTLMEVFDKTGRL